MLFKALKVYKFCGFLSRANLSDCHSKIAFPKTEQ